MKIIANKTYRSGKRQIHLGDASGGLEEILFGHHPTNGGFQAQIVDTKVGNFVGIHIDVKGAEAIIAFLTELVASVPPRWTDGDVVRMHGGKAEKIWTRNANRWVAPDHFETIADREIEAVIERGYRGERRCEILRQQSGQDA